MFLSNITSMWTDIKYDWLAERFHCTHRGEYCPKTCDLFGPHPHLLFLPDTNTFTDRCTSAQCFLASWTHSAMVVRLALLSNTWRRKMLTKLTSSCLAQITKAATEMWMLFKFIVALSTQRLYGLLGMGSPGYGWFLAFILSGWNMSGHCSWFLAFILSGWTSTTLWLGFGLYIIKLKYEWTLWLILGLCIIKFKHTYTHTCTHSHTYTFHLPCAWIYQIWPLSLCPTWITPIVVRECLEELLGSVWEAAKEDCAQTANVQSGGPFKLQLPDVVADDGTAVLQKQLAGLKQTT